MIKGIHHITAISSNPQGTYDFYTKTLGLRLVKMSVNQDDTQTYHLFFGDKLGHPGMDLTFFTFQPAMPGIRGNGMVTKISLAIPEDSLKFWKERFIKLKVKHEEKKTFGINTIEFYDEDEQRYELVALPDKEMDKDADVWTTDEVSKENAIRHFDSAMISTFDDKLVSEVLTYVFGYKKVDQEGNISLYQVGGSKRAASIEIEENKDGEYGRMGAGTVHHIAFRVEDERHQDEMRDKVIKLGLMPTEVIDRFYFKSVYFRTLSGVLFEIATDGPGFTADEKEANLGKKLALPPFLEGEREEIESNLIPIKLN